jgi:hypothetical protein
MANYKDIEQEQLIGYWIKRFGINRKDLTEHPQIDDVMLILQVRNFVKDNPGHISNREQAQLGAIWGYVYKKHYPLKRKYLNTLENVITQLNTRIAKTQQARQKIKALRNPYKKEDHMMTTTGSSATYNSLWK